MRPRKRLGEEERGEIISKELARSRFVEGFDSIHSRNLLGIWIHPAIGFLLFFLFGWGNFLHASTFLVVVVMVVVV